MEKQLKKYVGPNILAMVGTSCYILADTFFISQAAGAKGITALNLVLPIYAVIFALGAMIGVGSATRYALETAAGGQDSQHYFSNSIWFCLFFSIPPMLAGLFCPGDILTLLGADGEILPVGVPYLRLILLFSPFFMLNFAFTSFVRNDGAPKTAMAATLASGIFNILFDYLLMFPLKLGMTGAALATVISPMVSMSICLFHFLSSRGTIRFTSALPSVRRLVQSCTLGVAAFVGELSGGITTLIFNYLLLAQAGNVAVAAYGIIANIAVVVTALFNGVSQGLQPVASLAHGQMDTSGEARIYASARTIAVKISLAAVAAALFFAPALTEAFNSEGSGELAAYAVPGMRLYFLGFLLAAVNIVKSGFYSAVGKGYLSSVIALSRGFLSITVSAFVLSMVLGITGIWLAFPVSELITWLLSLWAEQPSGRRQNSGSEGADSTPL